MFDDNNSNNNDWIDSIDWTEGEEHKEGLSINGRKTLVPLFVYTIIRGNTSLLHQMNQEEIKRELDKYPYSVSDYERKALSRVVRTLQEEFPFIQRGTRGFYFDKKLPDKGGAETFRGRNKAGNSRKTLIPIFIIERLKACGGQPVTQKWIREQLEEAYGLVVERKALARILNLMVTEDLYVFGSGREGYYYDRGGYRALRDSE